MTRLRSMRRHRTTPSFSRSGPTLDDLRELGQLPFRQAGLGALGPVVDEALLTRPVEAMHPVAQRLAVHAADLRRRTSVHAVPDRSQRQQPPALVDVLRLSVVR